MHLHDLLGWPGPMTHRQFLAWQAWLDEQWDRPDRTDQYLMQIACEVARANAKHPDRLRLEHFRLRFGAARPAGRKLTPEEAAAASKARWMMAAGLNPGKARG